MKKTLKISQILLVFLLIQVIIINTKTFAFFLNDIFSITPVQANPAFTNPTKENVKKLYYNQLTSDIARNTYNALASSSGTTVKVELNVSYKLSEDSLVARQECFKTNIKPAIYDGVYAYLMDGGNWWWFSFEGEFYTLMSSDMWCKFTKYEMNSKFETEFSNRQIFNDKLNEACNSIKGNNIYEMVNNINTYICSDVEYSYKEDGNTVDGTGLNKTEYGAIVNGKCSNRGMARLFNEICRRKGLISINVDGWTDQVTETGVKNTNSWNYVYDSSNKKWYAVHVGWNEGENHNYYLMVGENTKINSKEFKKNHIPGKKYWDNQTFVPSVPDLAKDKYLKTETNIQYSTKEVAQNVEVQISSNIDLKVKDTWNLSSDKKTLTKTYSDNINEKVDIVNIYDETSSFDIEIDNIDSTSAYLTNINVLSPKDGIYKDGEEITIEATFSENVYASENKDIITAESAPVLEIKFENELKKAIFKSANNNKIVYSYKIEKGDNGKLQIINYYLNKDLYDQIGNSTTNIDLTNDIIENKDIIADTTELELNVDYTADEINHSNVTVRIVSNKQLQEIQGWLLSEDRKILTKIYTNNMEEEIIVKDLAGNEIKQKIVISGIEKETKIDSEDYTIENNLIKNIQPKTNYDNFIKNIICNKSYTIKEGNTIVTGTNKIKTGQVLTVGDKSYILIVTGDTNCDGEADLRDILEINKHRLKGTQLTGIRFTAGDVTVDGKLDIKDILKINKYRLGRVGSL